MFAPSGPSPPPDQSANPSPGPSRGSPPSSPQGNESSTPNSSSTGQTPPPTGDVASMPLYLRMFMDKYLGLTIEVLDAMGANQQSITMDGVKITTRVSGQQGDSVITQTSDTVSIDARNFRVNADSIRLTSTTGTSLQSMGQTNVSSLSDISLSSPGSISSSGLNGITLNGMSVSMNAMQSISMLAIGGGIAACGAAGGVQIMGSDISMTGLSVSIAAPTTAITSANLNFAAVPSPPQGSAASSSSSAAKGASGAAKVSSGALSASGSAYGMSNGSGAGSASGAPDTGGLLNLSASGAFSQGGSSGSRGSSGLPGSSGTLANPLANLPANSWANYISPASLSSNLSGWIGSDPYAVGNGMYDSFTSGLSSNPSPMGFLKSYNAASSQLTKAAAQSLKKQLDAAAPLLAGYAIGLPILLAGYMAVEYLSACSKVSAKISSGSLTAGDLMAFTNVGFKAIGDIAMALIKLLDTPLMGGEEDTNSIMPGLKPGDTDAVSALMDKLVPPKETGGSPMSGTILQQNSSVLATILGKIQKKKMSPPPSQGGDQSSQKGDQKQGQGQNQSQGGPKGDEKSGSKGTPQKGQPNGPQNGQQNGSQSGAPKGDSGIPSSSPLPFGQPPSSPLNVSDPGNTLNGGQNSSNPGNQGPPGTPMSPSGPSPTGDPSQTQSGVPDPGSQTPSDPKSSEDSGSSEIPTIQSLIAKVNPAVLSQMAPELTALAMKNLGKLLGPVGFLSVLHDIPGIKDLMAGNSELAALAQSLLPPGFLPSPSKEGESTQSNGTTPSESSPASDPSAPSGQPTTPPAAPIPSGAPTGEAVSPPGSINSPQPGAPSAAPPSDGSFGNPSSAPPTPEEEGTMTGSSEGDLESLLTLGGLMRNQWSLGLMSMDQVLSSLLPRGPLSELAASESQGGPKGGAPPSSPPSGPETPSKTPGTPPQNAGPQTPSSPSTPGESGSSSDDGGIDAAINEVFSPTIQCLGPLGVGAQGARSLIKNPLELVKSGFSSLSSAYAEQFNSMLKGDLATPTMPDTESMMKGGTGGGGTLLDEMKKKGSLLDGDYGTQFHKVLEKTYGNPIKALSVTLNPMDTMMLMSGHVQGMMMKERQPFEAASTFTMAAQPKTAQSDAELSSMMQYGENMLQAQQQLASFMKDLLTKSTAKMLTDMKADKKSAPPAKTPPPSDTKEAAQPTAPQNSGPPAPSRAQGSPTNPPLGKTPAPGSPQGNANAS